MKIEVPISNKSIEYMNEVFSEYNKAITPISYITGRSIFHIYPKQDTMNDDNDELNGFIDAVRFVLHIYDTERNLKYVYEMPDSLSCQVASDVRVFKDLSTMIIIDKPIRIIYGDCVSVYENN